MNRRTAVGAVATLVITAAACAPQTTVSPNRLSATTEFDKTTQLDVRHEPLVFVDYLCDVPGADWQQSPAYGFNDASPAKHSITITCAPYLVHDAHGASMHS